MIKRLAVVLPLLSLFFCLSPMPSAAETEEIRVGYMDYEGLITLDGKGGFQGYGVAYLNEVARFTGWEYEYEYEYVYGSWSDILELLKEGQLDLVCAAQYTEERASVYGYSEYPMGHESTVIYARPDDPDIYYEDYGAMDQKRIAIMRDSYQKQMTSKISENHGITLI